MDIDIILFLAHIRSMQKSVTKMRELLEQTGIGQTELARWLGVRDRTVRHYVKGDRTPDPGLILLLEYLADRPEAKVWFREKAEQHPKDK